MVAQGRGCAGLRSWVVRNAAAAVAAQLAGCVDHDYLDAAAADDVGAEIVSPFLADLCCPQMV